MCVGIGQALCGFLLSVCGCLTDWHEVLSITLCVPSKRPCTLLLGEENYISLKIPLLLGFLVNPLISPFPSLLPQGKDGTQGLTLTLYHRAPSSPTFASLLPSTVSSVESDVLWMSSLSISILFLLRVL